MNPLPPLGRIFLSHLSPVSVSPVGVCAFNLQTLPAGRSAQSGQAFAFTKITGSSTDGTYLLIDNQTLAKCATTTQANAISKLINTAIDASPDDREALVRAYIAKAFAANDAAAVFRESYVVINRIRWMCSILFVLLFAATPILADIFGLLRVLIPVGVVMIALAIQISSMFYRAHKTLYPHETQERMENVVKMVLCPPVSIRATDLLTKNLISQYSPVVLADILAGASAHSFIRSYVLDLQNPLKHEVSDETSVEIMTWAAAEHLRFCLEYIDRSSYLKRKVLLARPEQDDNSVSYCPRCGCQFVVSSGACPDCPGVGLLPFPIEADIGGAA